jgi:FkbM family methyltransferase
MANVSRLLRAFQHVSRTPEVLRSIRVIENWWPIASAYVGASKLPFPFTANCRDGATYELQEFYDLETLWQIYVREVYGVSGDLRVVLDAGANIGLFACYTAKRHPQCVVHAVEPFPGTVRRLRETVRRNALGERVRVHPVALSGKSGSARMSAAVEASQMVHLLPDAEGGAQEVTVVTTLTLSELISSIEAERIDLLKMDIEGSEYEVLSATPPASLSRVQAIALEYHKPGAAAPMDKRQLTQYLTREAGFLLREDPDDPAEYGMLHFTRR